MTATLANTAALVYVADLVTQAINAHDFGAGVEFTAERSYADWDLDLADADVLHVDVVPVGRPVMVLGSRGSVKYRVTVDIGIRKRFTSAESDKQTGRIDLAEVDRLVLLTEQIHEHLCGVDKRSLTDDVSWSESNDSDSYVTAHLRQNRQFTGLMRVAYDVFRTLEAAS